MANVVVCVTGGSGFVASWLVKVLLCRGYTVRATVRNLSDPSKVEHLKGLEGAQERLHLFQADLLDEVIHGCHGVFHTASPVILESHHLNNPQMELIEPAVSGTLNVLRSSLKRVVLTSSMSSVLCKKDPGLVADETWFSDPKLVEQFQHWYALSKTLGEEAAIKFAQENGVELVVINPGFMIGPLLQPSINATTHSIITMIKQGKFGEAMGGDVFLYVDVRDVAEAHVAAASAHGRYCLVAQVLPCSQALAILRRLYPTCNFPNSSEENESGFQVSNEKAKTLGVKFVSVDQSMKDTIQSLEDKNLFTLTPKSASN